MTWPFAAHSRPRALNLLMKTAVGPAYACASRINTENANSIQPCHYSVRPSLPEGRSSRSLPRQVDLDGNSTIESEHGELPSSTGLKAVRSRVSPSCQRPQRSAKFVLRFAPASKNIVLGDDKAEVTAKGCRCKRSSLTAGEFAVAVLMGTAIASWLHSFPAQAQGLQCSKVLRHQPEPDDGKVMIERICESNSRALHARKAGGVDGGQLVQIRVENNPKTALDPATRMEESLPCRACRWLPCQRDIPIGITIEKCECLDDHGNGTVKFRACSAQQAPTTLALANVLGPVRERGRSKPQSTKTASPCRISARRERYGLSTIFRIASRTSSAILRPDRRGHAQCVEFFLVEVNSGSLLCVSLYRTC
jgi:hypothetical protein